MTDTFLEPGKTAFLLGASGSGKSHTLRTALEHYGSGVVVMAQGLDEVESYRSLYPDADRLFTPADAERLLVDGDEEGTVRLAESEKPFLLASFDDEDFFPSLDAWDATGHKASINFLRLVKGRVRRALEAGEENPYKVLAVDTLSGIGQLATNAMLGTMKRMEPPKARGDGGAQYYIGYRNKVEEFCRACRAIRGFGTHWLAGSHVQMREASDTFSAQDVVGKEQEMPAFTGAVREVLPSFFDLVLYLGITKEGDHYAQWDPDRFRNAKSRYQMDRKVLDDEGRIDNDWPTIVGAMVRT